MTVPHAPIPTPANEPVRTYAPGSAERAALKSELDRMAGAAVDIPMWIGGKEERTGRVTEARSPHDKALLLGRAHEGSGEHVGRAIGAALAARRPWAAMSQSERSAIFLKAAELAATTHRDRLNAATMLGQSKTAYQAEIDAACELVDFLRFNAYWAGRLAEPLEQSKGLWNSTDVRPLEGFVAAITPFNFTAIAANLPSAPAMLGNVVVWKPSPLAMRSAYEVMELFRAAGLPDGVINLVHGPAEELVGSCLASADLAGVHFTGSTAVFRSIWQKIGENISSYKTYPRLVGETGGKDFVFAHASADLDALAVALVRGAFEFQGQKCSAASRAYIPRSIWPALEERVAAHIAAIRVGDVRDFRNLMGAVIDGRAYARLTSVIAEAKSSTDYRIVAGGGASDERGWFVHPTLVESKSPDSRLMKDEFFGPILTAWVYEDARVEEALEACDRTSGYALTGAVFSQDRTFLSHAAARLRDAAGNFYVNDKPTGAVVGQQPFGGGRASGTNDKAGSPLNLHRWVSPRSVKETFVPPHVVGYPSMDEA
ncbi:MAG TPA: L-glutamate gamma-semialdehyde dehydrogenase [Polyangiaceae bacterium]|nr:L-glutamate gamma-semialdehyde dehydrogenase [Polyangiaceae bacterium]